MNVPVFTRSRAGLWTILSASAVQVPHTGNTDETALATVTVPGGAMGANGILRVTTMWTWTNSANDKIPRIRLGGISGTIYFVTTQTTTASNRWQTQIHNRNATNSQVGFNSAASSPFVSATLAVATSAVDTAAATTLVLSGQLENTGETIALEYYLVELAYRP